MGYYFANDVTYIDNDIVSSLRQVPMSGGGLSQIWLPGFFDVTKWRRLYIKEWGRRWYPKSKRCVMIYRTDTLLDGIYEIQSIHTEQDGEGEKYKEYIAHYFEIKGGDILLLDNANQAIDRLQEKRGNLDYIVSKIRRKHGYSIREIEHMVKVGSIPEQYAEELKIERAEKEAAYAAEQPTANLQ